jgi:hypothetical protein
MYYAQLKTGLVLSSVKPISNTKPNTGRLFVVNEIGVYRQIDEVTNFVFTTNSIVAKWEVS